MSFLNSMSKREIKRYVKLLREQLKFQINMKNQFLVKINELDKANTALHNRLDATKCALEERDYFWRRRLSEAERMFELKTADFKRHNQALMDNICSAAMMRAPTPIIIKTNELKIAALEGRLANLQTHIRTVAENLVKPL